MESVALLALAAAVAVGVKVAVRLAVWLGSQGQRHPSTTPRERRYWKEFGCL